MGEAFLICGALLGSFFHHCDTCMEINLIKFGGSFEEISLVHKPFLVCFKDKLYIS